MKRGIALIICLFAMTTRAHLTHAADASPHEDELASVKRKADHSDDLDQKKKRAARHAAYRAANKEKIAARHAVYYAANKKKIAAYRAANKEKIAAQHAARYAANKKKIAAYRAANKEKIAAQHAARYAAKKEKIAALATGNPADLASLQERIDKAQDQPGAGENSFLKKYNGAFRAEEQMNPATPRAALAAEILCNLVKKLQSEQAALRQGDDESEEADAANFTPRTPYQALEDLLSDNEESPVEDDE